MTSRPDPRFVQDWDLLRVPGQRVNVFMSGKAKAGEQGLLVEHASTDALTLVLEYPANSRRTYWRQLDSRIDFEMVG